MDFTTNNIILNNIIYFTIILDNNIFLDIFGRYDNCEHTELSTPMERSCTYHATIYIIHDKIIYFLHFIKNVVILITIYY